jgi:hypothetical protein
MFKRLIPLAAAGALAAAPAAAAADVTVTVGQPELTAGVSVSVPMTVTCAGLDPALTEYADSVGVSISQAVNKEIAHGSASVSGGTSMFGPVPLLFACDGTPTAVTVSVPAATDGPPFKRNRDAVVTAAATAYGGTPCGYPGCFFNTVVLAGSSGAVAVKLR